MITKQSSQQLPSSAKGKKLAPNSGLAMNSRKKDGVVKGTVAGAPKNINIVISPDNLASSSEATVKRVMNRCTPKRARIIGIGQTSTSSIHNNTAKLPAPKQISLISRADISTPSVLNRSGSVKTATVKKVPKNAKVRKIDLQPGLRSEEVSLQRKQLKGRQTQSDKNIDLDGAASRASQSSTVRQRSLKELIGGARFSQTQAINNNDSSARLPFNQELILKNQQSAQDESNSHFGGELEDTIEDDSARKPAKCLSPTINFKRFSEGQGALAASGIILPTFVPSFTPTRKITIEKQGSISQKNSLDDQIHKFSKSLSHLNRFFSGEKLPESAQEDTNNVKAFNLNRFTRQIVPPLNTAESKRDMHNLQSMLSDSCNSLGAASNKVRRESFLSGFLTKSVLLQDAGQSPISPQELKKSMVEALINQNEFSTQPQGIDRFSIQNSANNSMSQRSIILPKRQSQGADMTERPLQSSSARAAFLKREKSKSELNNHMAAPNADSLQCSKTSAISVFEENPTKGKSLNCSARDFLQPKQYRTKHTMKNILKKSHQKLTQLLDKANKDKEEAAESFTMMETLNNESLKNFQNIDESEPSPKVHEKTVAPMVSHNISVSSTTKKSHKKSSNIVSVKQAQVINLSHAPFQKRNDLSAKNMSDNASRSNKPTATQPTNLMQQVSRKTLGTQRTTPRNFANTIAFGSQAQIAQSHSDLRRVEKVNSHYYQESKQSTIMTEGKDHHKRKLMESNTSNKIYTQLTSKRHNLPISAKLEGKYSMSVRKVSSAVLSQQAEQAARLSAIKHTRQSQQSSQKNQKSRQEIGQNDITKSFGINSVQKMPSMSHIGGTAKQNLIQKSASMVQEAKFKDLGPNKKVGQYQFLKTPSKGHITSSQKKQSSSSHNNLSGAGSTVTKKSSQTNNGLGNTVKTPTTVGKNHFQSPGMAQSSIAAYMSTAVGSNQPRSAALAKTNSRKQGILESKGKPGKAVGAVNSMRGLALQIKSEDAASFSENLSQKNIQVDPCMRTSQLLGMKSTTNRQQQHTEEDEGTPLISQRKQLGTPVTIITLQESVTERKLFESSSVATSSDAHSNLQKAMNFHRGTYQDPLEASNALNNEKINDQRQEEAKFVAQNFQNNPIVTLDSDNFDNIDEKSAGDGVNLGEDIFDDGEQRYETDGEENEQTNETQAAERVQAPLREAMTPPIQLQPMHTTESEGDPNEQENFDLIREDYARGSSEERQDNFSALDEYNLSSRPEALKSDGLQDEQVVEGSSLDLALEDADDPQTRTIDEFASVSGRQVKLFNSVAIGRLSEAPVKDRDPVTKVAPMNKRLTLRQVLNQDFQKRQSMHCESQIQVSSLDPIRQRTFAKSRRDQSDDRQRQTQTKQDSQQLQQLEQRNRANSDATGQNIFGSNLSTFLRVKASRAYEIGEGLVMSITSREKHQSSVEQIQQDSTHLQDGLRATRIPKNSLMRSSRQVEPQAERDTLLSQEFYGQNLMNPPQSQRPHSMSVQNIDTQVMNIEADFEQLDIGEEPIFERNTIKQTATNNLKDKMSLLQVKNLKKSSLIQQIKSKIRAKSGVPTFEKTRGTIDKINAEILSAMPSQAEVDTFSQGPVTQQSNTVDYTQSMSQFASLNRKVDRQTLGNERSIYQQKEDRLTSRQLSGPLDTMDFKLDVQGKSTTSSVLIPSVRADEGRSLMTARPVLGETDRSELLPQPLVKAHDRRRNNRSTYVERTLFGTAIERLFGNDSIFSALDDPLDVPPSPRSVEKRKPSLQKHQRFSRSLERRKQSLSQASNASSYGGIRVKLLKPALALTDPNYRKYTLVLDLDETLVHFEHRRMVYKVRPLCIRFLTDMAKLYEIVIFTAAHQTYANFILDKLDKDGKLIQHRLYRQHTSQVRGAFIKDLARLGRPLERTLIIDNLRENFSRQKENGIECGTWKGDVQDRQLNTLSIFLTKLAAGNVVEDIRPHITVFKATFDPHSLK